MGLVPTCVDYLLVHNKLFPKFRGLKQYILIIFQFLQVRNWSTAYLLGCLWLRLSHGVVVKLLARTEISNGEKVFAF